MSQELPTEVSETLEALEAELDDASFRKVESEITDYSEWVIENYGGFDFEGEEGNLRKIHAEYVDSYLKHLKKEGYARRTISSRHQWVSRLYSELSSFLNGPEVFDESPFTLLEKQNNTWSHYLPEPSKSSQEKRQYYVDKTDLEILCENVGAPAFRNECLLRLMWTTGLRCSEVCNLKVSDVDPENNYLRDFWVPKTSNNRTLWVPEETMWFLTQYLEGGYRDSFSYAEGSDYLFLSNRSPEMHKQTPNKIVRRAADEAGIQEKLGTDQSGSVNKVTAHALRRGHGMHLWKAGKDLRTIQRRLGHSSIEQTEEYLPISVEESKEKLEDVRF